MDTLCPASEVPAPTHCHSMCLNVDHRFGIFGGVSFPQNGTFAEYIVVEKETRCF